MRSLIALCAPTVLLICACVPESAERTVGDRGPQSPARCAVVEVGRDPIALPSGETVYVEPHAFEANEGGFLLAGQPALEWTQSPDGRATLTGQGRFFGVIVENGITRTIAHPPGVRLVGWMHSVVLGPSRWGFLIEDRIEDEEESAVGISAAARIWYAEYDGHEWSTPEEVGIPTGGRVTVATGSGLALHEGRVFWAARFAKDQGGADVMVFERSASGWRQSIVAEDWVDEVGLHLTQAGDLWVAIGGLDPEHGSQLASMRITQRVGGGSTTTRLSVGAPGDRFRDPRFVRSAGGAALAWRHLEASTALGSAWLQRSVGAGRAPGAAGREPAVLLDRSALDLLPLVHPDGATIWLTHHVGAATDTETLRILRDDGTELSTLTEIPYPYRGPFRASVTPSGDLLVVGPQVDPDPLFPSVRSLVLRLSLSCA